MGFFISYGMLVIFITICFVLVRVTCAAVRKKIDWKQECKLLTVYVCLVVIARLVYFPWNLVDGHIEKMFIYNSKDIVNTVNPVPFVHLTDIYDGWQRNVFGNVAMFIPVGLSWPFCFKKIDRVWKATLAGFGLSLFIEISQLFVFGRSSDIDDLITNTLGAFIGALIYFGIVKLINMNKPLSDRHRA